MTSHVLSAPEPPWCTTLGGTIDIANPPHWPQGAPSSISAALWALAPQACLPLPSHSSRPPPSAVPALSRHWAAPWGRRKTPPSLLVMIFIIYFAMYYCFEHNLYRQKKKKPMKIKNLSISKSTPVLTKVQMLTLLRPPSASHFAFCFDQITIFQNILPHTETVYILVSVSQVLPPIAIGVCLMVFLLFSYWSRFQLRAI